MEYLFHKLIWQFRNLLLAGFLVFNFHGCSKKDAPAAQDPDGAAKTAKEKALFPLGAAVSVAHLKEADFAAAYKNNYSQLSAEYEMKMKPIWTSSTGYAFDNPDYLVNFALQNGMKVHGHALLWYQSYPDWFTNATKDSAYFESNVKTYIQTVVGRYKGKIRSWDVANEIFADDGSMRADVYTYKSFKDPLGFYGRCFKYARNSDPDVKLFYNDYDLVLNNSKRNAVRKMVERFKKEGFPIDGIGEQCHTTIWTNKTTIGSGLTDLATIGLLIHISELDIRVNQNKSDTYVFTDAEKQKQSDMYKSVVQSFETIPQLQKFAITTWGVSDKYTWMTSWWHPKEYPLLFDSNYAPKKAYDGFLSGLK